MDLWNLGGHWVVVFFSLGFRFGLILVGCLWACGVVELKKEGARKRWSNMCHTRTRRNWRPSCLSSIRSSPNPTPSSPTATSSPSGLISASWFAFPPRPFLIFVWPRKWQLLFIGNCCCTSFWGPCLGLGFLCLVDWWDQCLLGSVILCGICFPVWRDYASSLMYLCCSRTIPLLGTWKGCRRLRSQLGKCH